MEPVIDWIHFATEGVDVVLERGRLWSLVRMDPDPVSRLDALATRQVTETED